MATATPGPRLYRSRRPERTLLYRALAASSSGFCGVYEERFEPTHGYLRHWSRPPSTGFSTAASSPTARRGPTAPSVGTIS